MYMQYNLQVDDVRKSARNHASVRNCAFRTLLSSLRFIPRRCLYTYMGKSILDKKII